LIRLDEEKTSLYRSLNIPSPAKVYILTDIGKEIIKKCMGVPYTNVNTSNNSSSNSLSSVTYRTGKLTGKHGIEYKYKVIDYPIKDTISWHNSWKASTTHYSLTLNDNT